MEAARPASFPLLIVLAASSFIIHLGVLAITLLQSLFRYVPLDIFEDRAGLKSQLEQDRAELSR